MTIEQKKTELKKIRNKITKLQTYIKNNPPKTAKHAFKLMRHRFCLMTEYYKILAQPLPRPDYKKGGLEIVGEKRTEYIISSNGNKYKL